MNEEEKITEDPRLSEEAESAEAREDPAPEDAEITEASETDDADVITFPEDGPEEAGYDYTLSPGYDIVFGHEEEEEVPQYILQRKRTHKKKHYFLKFCAVTALLAALICFMMSSYFDIGTIKVTGNNNVKAAEILKLSGVKKGDNIFSKLIFHNISTKNAIKKELFIKDVSIGADLPKILILNVVERRPNCAILIGRNFLLLDDDGFIIKKYSKRPGQTTLLEGVKIKNSKEGETAQADSQDQLSEMLALIKMTNENDLFFKKIVRGGSVTRAYVYDGLLVKGTTANIEKQIKNGNLKKVLFDLYKKKIKRGTVSVGKERYISFSPKIK